MRPLPARSSEDSTRSHSRPPRTDPHFLPPHAAFAAIDFHEIPYYGEAIDRRHLQYVKTRQQRRTHRAYRYVPLDLVVQGFRFSVSSRYLDCRGRLVSVLQDVLHDAERAGVQIGRLYLDQEFYGYEVFSGASPQGLTVICPPRLG